MCWLKWIVFLDWPFYVFLNQKKFISNFVKLNFLYSFLMNYISKVMRWKMSIGKKLASFFLFSVFRLDRERFETKGTLTSIFSLSFSVYYYLETSLLAGARVERALAAPLFSWYRPLPYNSQICPIFSKLKCNSFWESSNLFYSYLSKLKPSLLTPFLLNGWYSHCMIHLSRS